MDVQMNVLLVPFFVLFSWLMYSSDFSSGEEAVYSSLMVEQVFYSSRKGAVKGCSQHPHVSLVRAWSWSECWNGEHPLFESW